MTSYLEMLKRLGEQGRGFPLGDRARRLRGHFMFEAIRETVAVGVPRASRVSQRVAWMDAPNLIVDAGYTRLLEALAGVAGRAVTQLAVGTNGTAPAAGDVAITGATVVAVANAGIRPITEGVASIAFQWNVPPNTITGTTVREFGLLNASGQLIARKTYPAGVLVEEDIRLAGAWTLFF